MGMMLQPLSCCKEALCIVIDPRFSSPVYCQNIQNTVSDRSLRSIPRLRKPLLTPSTLQVNFQETVITHIMYRGVAFIFYGYRHFTQPGYQRAAKNFKEDISKVDLSNKSCLITGGNSGIGFASAKYFAQRGATVYIVCRNEEKGQTAINTIKSDNEGAKVELCLLDVSRPCNIRQFVDDFIKSGKTLDILVNNAGVMLDNEEYTEDHIEKTLATNTLATYYLTKLLQPVLRKSEDGRVISVSSGGMLTENLLTRKKYDVKPWLGRTAYARTKRHQVALMQKFHELEPEGGIKYFSMHPGWADTPAGVVLSERR